MKQFFRQLEAKWVFEMLRISKPSSKLEVSLRSSPRKGVK